MYENLTWVELPQLLEHLCCSESVIYALKRNNVIKAGTHFYSLSKQISKGGKHIYCVELIRQTLLDQTAAEAKAASRKIKKQETYNDNHIKELVSGAKS